MLRRETKTFLKKEFHKIYSAELLDVLFYQPYYRIIDLIEAEIAKRQAAAGYLKQLVEAGLLAEEKVGRKNSSHISDTSNHYKTIMRSFNGK